MADLERLQAIKTFPSLVKYLRDELDWPIDADDFDDLTFDWEPEELGIDTKTAAKIEEIKQLRPLESSQPWGIFFVKFEPKRLPVVALRRILGSLVIRKRASARKADRAAWDLHDLLFISNYGEGNSRQITLAHFSEDETFGDLPTLRVLGWDDADTVLHIHHVHRELKEKFSWPENPSDIPAWRSRWSSVFTLRHKEVITTSKDLAERLAKLAADIRKRVNTILRLETEQGPLRRLQADFKKVLIHDLSDDDFADMYAQTITYGLLTARVSRPANLVAENVTDMVPITNPFLRDLLGTFLTVGGRKGKIDFDEVGINDVVQILRDANMEAILRDFGDRKPEEDPVIFFYEDFLTAYDKNKKVRRGVFYTPKPVVSFIVRSIHEQLKERFGLEDGLADVASWGEMAKRHKGLKMPESVRSETPFVQILDPATGTGTFLVEVIEIIHRTLKAKWQTQGLTRVQQQEAWNNYVPENLLPRLHGYELMMAPYAIAHMKIGLKLYETGYEFGSQERARIYLANALDPPTDVGQLALFSNALAHEARAVNDIKRHKSFTVVMGNPPYSLQSANLEPQHRATVEAYKFIDGERIQERSALQLEKNLNDDYVKFFRLSQLAIQTSSIGIIGLITNHSFLDNPTMRAMRWSLMQTASCIYVNDLHGNSTKKELPPTNIVDTNVFQIKQGVAITVLIALPDRTEQCKVFHHEVWGSRNTKETWFSNGSIISHKNQLVAAAHDLYLFIPQNSLLREEFETALSLPSIMPLNGAGYITARDNLVVDFDRDALVDRIHFFNCSILDNKDLLTKFNVSEKKGWDITRARRELKKVDIPHAVIQSNYRPFDARWIFFDSTLVWGRSWPTMQHLAGHPENVSLLATRMTKDKWDVFVARQVSSHKAMSAYDTNSVFPLYLYENIESAQQRIKGPRKINFSREFLRELASTLSLPHIGRNGLPEGIAPEIVFFYAYAVFYSPSYRSRYAEFLKSDFPRLLLTRDLELFRALAQFGSELVGLHLMESPKLDRQITTYAGPINPEVEKVSFSDDTVWLDKAQTFGFRGVPEVVWNFHIGGYQVCHKWLKDRKGRTLSKNDIEHYHRIVVALHETIRLMKEIDVVIDQYGGWPGAFTSST